jgi:hypothetical protein
MTADTTADVTPDLTAGRYDDEGRTAEHELVGEP